jgi:hypothetical protein
MPVKYKASRIDAQVIDNITAQVIKNLDDWYGNPSELDSRMPEIRTYTNSFLLRYKVKTSGGNIVILVKIRRNPKMRTLNEAIRASAIHVNIPAEYRTLQFVYDRTGDGHANFTAIRPLAYFEDYFAIVMEELPSRSLRELLYTNRKSANSDELIHAGRKAGELLRFFHEHVHSVVDRPYSVNNILSDVEPYASRLESYSRGRVKAASILDAFTQKFVSREILSIPYSESHQDMTCDNVLYSEDEKVCLIDIKTKPAPIYSDLALLLIHPETFRDQIVRSGRYFPRQFLSEYRTSILTGYFSGKQMNNFLVNLFCALRVLDKWTMHEELLSRYKGIKRVLTRPFSPQVTSYFRALFNRYMESAT